MAEKKKIDNRARVWTFIVYPESAPKNWRDILDGFHIGWIESPLHDKDVNPDGKLKKAHWHIMIMFEGKKSFLQVKEISEVLHAPIPQKVASPKGMVRYFIHLDNPEKYQYNKQDIIAHGGADVESYFQMTMSGRQEVLNEIIAYILDNHVTSLAKLSRYALENENYDWLDVITNHNTLYLTALLKSEWQDGEHNITKKDFSNAEKVKIMKENGISVTKIADTLGISRVMVYKYLKD